MHNLYSHYSIFFSLFTSYLEAVHSFCNAHCSNKNVVPIEWCRILKVYHYSVYSIFSHFLYVCVCVCGNTLCTGSAYKSFNEFVVHHHFLQLCIVFKLRSHTRMVCCARLILYWTFDLLLLFLIPFSPPSPSLIQPDTDWKMETQCIFKSEMWRFIQIFILSSRLSKTWLKRKRIENKKELCIAWNPEHSTITIESNIRAHMHARWVHTSQSRCTNAFNYQCTPPANLIVHKYKSLFKLTLTTTTNNEQRTSIVETTTNMNKKMEKF